jgi:type VI secretion system protein VasG
MRGLTESLENHHKVRILDEAVAEAVKLSHRYITGRQLPDKSVSVLDTACARVAIGQGAIPAQVEDSERRISQIATEIRALERESITGVDHSERISELKAAKVSTEAVLTALQAQWEKERGIIEQIREIRSQLEEYSQNGGGA